MADETNEHAEETAPEQPVSQPEEPVATPSEGEPESADDVTAEPAEEVTSEAPAAEADPAGDQPTEPEPLPAEEASGDEPVEPEPVTAASTVPAVSEPKPARSKRRLPRSQRRQRSKPKREQSGERKPIVRLPKPESEPGRRQERRGVVVSSGMDKTIVVKVDTIKAHRRYKKVVRRSTKLHAHDERNEAGVGDVVRIVETRPLSKTKNWRLAEVVEAAR